MSDLAGFIAAETTEGLLPWRAQLEAAARYGVSLAVVEEEALESSILPARYQRNLQTISLEQQLRLFRSTVAVVGCGGLGGYVIEQLARLGVGTIIAVDPDVFEEHNLNRQLFSTPAVLGRAKVEVAAERVAQINPAVTLVAHRVAYCAENGAQLFRGAAVAVDALDSIPTRLALAATCTALGIPMVHGAIGGWYGQVATHFPGDRSLERIYGGRENGVGAEKKLGNPAFTPAVVASLQVAETCKLLLGIGEALRGRKLTPDLFSMEMVEIPL